MNEDRKRILNLVSAGKITIEEAEQLLDALDRKNGTPVAAPAQPEGQPGPKRAIRFLRAEIHSANGDTVNVRVPVGLLRAGLKLSSLIPPQAMAKMNENMSRHGMHFDLNNLKPQDIEMLIEGLAELNVDIDAKNGDTVKVYCE